MPNRIGVIAPYWLDDAECWVFDDPSVGLVREPFVAGVTEMIDDLVRDIPQAQLGFRLLFSSSPFPGFTRELTWLREEMDGNWYRLEGLNLEGWLCPALFHYFDAAPRVLYVKAEPKRL